VTKLHFHCPYSNWSPEPGTSNEDLHQLWLQ
jgi:hypothetical protein